MADDPVSQLIVALRADVTQLKVDLDKARKEIDKHDRRTKQHLRGLRAQFKGLREPISNISQLANGMGTAFGGAASKATGLANGLVSSFAAGGVVGIALGATTGLVSVLIDRFQEAKEQAQKAAAARVEAFDSEVGRLQGLIDGYDALIAKQKNAALGAFDVQKSSLEAQLQGAQATQEILEKQRGSLLQNLENYREQLKQAGAYSAADFEQLGAVKKFREEAAALEQPIRQQGMLVEKYTQTIERLNVAASKVGGRALAGRLGSGGGRAGAGGVIGTAADAGPTGDPFATRESLAAYLKAGIAEQTRRDEAAAALREAAEANRKTAKAVQQLGEASADAALELGGLGGVIGSALGEGDTAGAFSGVAGFFGKQLLNQIPVVGPFLSELLGGLGLAKGGLVGFAGGGPVAASDTVPAMLTPGEYVLPVSAVRELGVGNLERLRRGGSASVSMGGINVTINGAANQSVIRQLRRELVTQGDSLSRALAAVLEKQTGLRLSNT